MGQEDFGAYIKAARMSRGLTLRDVERLTNGFINNSYLSQIEHGKISRPALEYLNEFSRLYGLSFADLLGRVGYPIPKDLPAGVDILDGLHEDDRRTLINYAAFLRKQRGSATST